MNYSDDLCKLVINNMDIIEEAPSVVAEIEEKLFESINERIKERINTLDGWEGVYDFYTEKNEDEEETVFRGPHWPVDEEGSYLAWYELDGINEEEMEHWLTYAVGEKNCSLIFKFNSDKEYHGKKLTPKKALLKSYLENTTELKEAGVIFIDDKKGSLGIPFHLDSQKMYEEYPDFDESLKPVDEALYKLIKVHPHFDTLVEELPK